MTCVEVIRYGSRRRDGKNSVSQRLKQGRWWSLKELWCFGYSELNLSPYSLPLTQGQCPGVSPFASR